MTVAFIPGPPPVERVVRFAMAGILSGLKTTRRAAQRCRKRLARAVSILEDGAETREDPKIAQAAADWLRQGCAICRKCPGLAVMPPPR